jgi:hypothetical protein
VKVVARAAAGWHDRPDLGSGPGVDKEAALDTLLWVAVVGGLAGGAAVYALVRRDLGDLRASLVAVGTFLALAIGWLLALYGAVLGIIAAILVYAVARARFGTGRALLAAGGSYIAVVVGVAALTYASLDTM